MINDVVAVLLIILGVLLLIDKQTPRLGWWYARKDGKIMASWRGKEPPSGSGENWISNYTGIDGTKWSSNEWSSTFLEK